MISAQLDDEIYRLKKEIEALKKKLDKKDGNKFHLIILIYIRNHSYIKPGYRSN
jgi:hypothetical protein